MEGGRGREGAASGRGQSWSGGPGKENEGLGGKHCGMQRGGYKGFWEIPQ